MVSIPTDRFLAIGLGVLFVLAVVGVFLARDWIRARFRRNMPSEGFRGDTKGWPPPPRPWPAPPPVRCPVHGELPDGGPCRECERAKLEKRERSLKEFGESIQRMSSALAHGTCRGRRWRKTTATSGPRYACDRDRDGPLWHDGIFENGQACPGCGRIINATDADGLSAKDRAQLVEANAWSFLLRHAPDLTPAEAFEKAEAWQKIMEAREAAIAEGRDPSAPEADRGWIDHPPFTAPPALKERCAVHGIFFPAGPAVSGVRERPGQNRASRKGSALSELGPFFTEPWPLAPEEPKTSGLAGSLTVDAEALLRQIIREEIAAAFERFFPVRAARKPKAKSPEPIPTEWPGFCQGSGAACGCAIYGCSCGAQGSALPGPGGRLFVPLHRAGESTGLEGCPECGGRTIEFSGSGMELQRRTCTRYREPGHLTKSLAEDLLIETWARAGRRWA